MKVPSIINILSRNVLFRNFKSPTKTLYHSKSDLVNSSYFSTSSASSSSSSSSSSSGYEKACFGAGCFWGTEKFFKTDFQKRYPTSNLVKGKVGYMGPSTALLNPSYRDVCSGNSQHVEVYSFSYQGGDAMYEALCKHFFTFHDPTTFNRQGNDIGSQYASVIFYYSDRQKAIAENVKQDFQNLLNQKLIRYSGKNVMTDIKSATIFYEAEPEHQEYLANNPGGYCNHFYRIDESRL